MGAAPAIHLDSDDPAGELMGQLAGKLHACVSSRVFPELRQIQLRGAGGNLLLAQFLIGDASGVHSINYCAGPFHDINNAPGTCKQQKPSPGEEPHGIEASQESHRTSKVGHGVLDCFNTLGLYFAGIAGRCHISGSYTSAPRSGISCRSRV